MWDHVKRELGSLPIDHEEMEEVVSSIVQKSQGIFLWVSRAVQEILATAHTRGGVEKALAAIPPEMSEFFGRILDEMSTKLRDTTKRLKTYYSTRFALSGRSNCPSYKVHYNSTLVPS
jgi:hypothetical protein